MECDVGDGLWMECDVGDGLCGRNVMLVMDCVEGM